MESLALIASVIILLRVAAVAGVIALLIYGGWIIWRCKRQ